MSRLSESEMQEVIDTIKRDNPANVWKSKLKAELEHTFCHVTWETSYRESAGSFLTHTVPRMQVLGDEDDVRCVFWFDS